MSFTANIYNEILSDISSGTGQTFPFAMRLVKFDNGIMIAFAVNIATRMRSAFLSVTSEVYKRQVLICHHYSSNKVEGIFCC